MAEFAEAAAEYAAMGIYVLPLAHNSKLPAISSREGGKGVHDATVDPNVIVAWSRRYPKANIGLACGAVSGFVVIDIDPRNGGDESFLKLAAAGRVFPQCPTAQTGGGGTHLLLRFDERIHGSKDKLGRGIDIKSTGGYIVAPPSYVTPKDDRGAGHYFWTTHPRDVPPPRAPIWLTTLLAPPLRTQTPQPARQCNADRPISGLLSFISSVGEGNRNNSLYWASRRMAELIASGSVTRASAEGALLSAALTAGLPMRESQATIQSGLRGGTGPDDRRGRE